MNYFKSTGILIIHTGVQAHCSCKRQESCYCISPKNGKDEQYQHWYQYRIYPLSDLRIDLCQESKDELQNNDRSEGNKSNHCPKLISLKKPYLNFINKYTSVIVDFWFNLFFTHWYRISIHIIIIITLRANFKKRLFDTLGYILDSMSCSSSSSTT